jgi:VCBS repeat-containing protein
MTVTQATADIAVTGYSVPYDGLSHTASGTATGVLAEDLSAGLDLSGTSHTAAGDYPLDAWTFHDAAGNYADASGTVADAISTATLTITADDRTKTYGTTVTFAGTEFTVTGLQGTDAVDSVTLTSPGAGSTANVTGSPYSITASAAVGTGLTNYTISYVPGALTVATAGLTITADDQAKPSGVDFIFDGTEFSTTGLVNADTVDSATLTSAGAPAAAAPGAYPIDVSAATGTGLANYTIAYLPGTMEVGNTAPDIGDATVTTHATASVSGIVPVIDPDTGQTVTLTISSAPAHGTATLAQDGSFTYSPTGTYTGRDTFTIHGCDDAPVPACDSGTVSIAIHPVAVDDAAVTSHGETVEVDVQANDIGDAGTPQIVTGPAHGTATVGSIIYTPDTGFSGTDHVVYRICSPNDATVCDDATLTVTVEAAPPTAPPTDAQPGLATPLGSVGATGAVLVGLATLVLVLTVAVLMARGRRRGGSSE